MPLCIRTTADANMVIDLKAKQLNQTTVEVAWEAPPSPNGQVLAYKVSLTGEQKVFEVCIPAQSYL